MSAPTRADLDAAPSRTSRELAAALCWSGPERRRRALEALAAVLRPSQHDRARLACAVGDALDGDPRWQRAAWMDGDACERPDDGAERAEDRAA